MRRVGAALAGCALLALLGVRAGEAQTEPDPAADRVPGQVHVTAEQMPWRIAIAKPKRPPKFGGSQQARDAAIEAMRAWEVAIQPRLPWFRLEFVEEDPAAPVQVIWKRRMTGPWWGFGRAELRMQDGEPSAGGLMEISTTPDNHTTLTVDEVRRLVAHEFGHVLGLGNCLDCESAMNYSWSTREQVLVTEVDVRSFVELVTMPTEEDLPEPRGSEPASGLTR